MKVKRLLTLAAALLILPAATACDVAGVAPPSVPTAITGATPVSSSSATASVAALPAPTLLATPATQSSFVGVPTLTVAAPAAPPSPPLTPATQQATTSPPVAGTPPATPDPSGYATPTDEPSLLDVPSPTVAASEAATATIVAELEATVVAGVRPTATPDSTGMSPFSGIDGIGVLRLDNRLDTRELWAAYSTGSRSFDDPVQQHFLSIYQRVGSKWRRAASLDLHYPDYVSDGALSQIRIEPGRIWLEHESGVGAHGGCIDIVSYDGKEIREEVSHCGSSPGAGWIDDINADGTNEVLLNLNEDYVFCYACGVSLIRTGVIAWDGTQLTERAVEDLPLAAPAELRTSNNLAADLFRHELMKDAAAEIMRASALDQSNATVRWNKAIIELVAGERREHVADSPYPILANVFYGDYDAAVDLMRKYDPSQVFTDTSPLIMGTPAEDNEEQLVQWITSTTTLALESKPDLAGAYLLRGWARHLKDYADAGALDDLVLAASLAPADPFYAACLTYLREDIGRPHRQSTFKKP